MGYSLYLHIPFCKHRCGYCDFNTYAGMESLLDDYCRALQREARFLALAAGERLPIQTVFFGGGTPSLVPADNLGSIMDTVRQVFETVQGLEISLEANPGTLSPGYLQEIHTLGVNRLSLGMQSASPLELRILERRHSFEDVVRAVGWARQAGFDNLSLDLIFGLPEQTIEAWRRSLSLALELHPEHLSLYALSIEPGTPFKAWVGRGLMSEPDPDETARMYEWAAERMEAEGYVHYEISNWARKGSQGEVFACRHNLQYWRNLPYIGLGAGAHGYLGGVRIANVLAPAAYIERCAKGHARRFPRTPATAQVRPIDQQAEMQETMMMGLRLIQEGVSRQGFEARFGQPLEQAFGRQLEELLAMGLIEWRHPDCGRLCLTPRGRLLGNQVFMRFV